MINITPDNIEEEESNIFRDGFQVYFDSKHNIMEEEG
jgi:hypothetical protein